MEDQFIRDRTYYRVQVELDRLDAEFFNRFPGIKIRRYSSKPFPKSASASKPNPHNVQRYSSHPQKWEEHEQLHVYLNQMELALRRKNVGENSKEDGNCAPGPDSPIEQLAKYSRGRV